MSRILITGLVLSVTFSTANSLAQEDPSTDEKGVPVKINLKRGEPICTLGGTGNLEYGTLQAPLSGTRTASFDPAVGGGDFSYRDDSDTELVPSGTQRIGTMSVTAYNLMRGGKQRIQVFSPNEGIVLRRCDGESDESGSCSLDYSLAVGWLYDEESGGTWQRLSPGDRIEFGDEDPKIIYLQFGGDVIIPAGTPNGTYKGTLTVRVSCVN